ncbi:MAG: hypothetical protein M1827_005739 [Pycnora praestabilis]|nr:MAG: hypothetical protein M1827_005739 [Pycnora praestabilis]
MGTNLPAAWVNLNYTQTFDTFQTETNRQLQPFLNARLQPDVILFKNEGSDGMLYTDASGHVHRDNDGKASTDSVNQELCGQISTSTMGTYSQLAGIVYSNQSGLETTGKDRNENPCASAADMLDIMGFSNYSDPMTPANKTQAGLDATFGRLNSTLLAITNVANAYGRWTDGPFIGQYKKQALGVEYATAFTYPAQQSEQLKLTAMMFDIIRPHELFLGELWYEPRYCISDWVGGNGALSHKWVGPQNFGNSAVAPTVTMKLRGQQVVSPWMWSIVTSIGGREKCRGGALFNLWWRNKEICSFIWLYCILKSPLET